MEMEMEVEMEMETETQPKLSEIKAKDFKITPMSEEQKEKDERGFAVLQRQMKQKIDFIKKPSDTFNALILDGTVNKVATAQMKKENLTLRMLMHRSLRKLSESQISKQGEPAALAASIEEKQTEKEVELITTEDNDDIDAESLKVEKSIECAKPFMILQASETIMTAKSEDIISSGPEKVPLMRKLTAAINTRNIRKISSELMSQEVITEEDEIVCSSSKTCNNGETSLIRTEIIVDSDVQDQDILSVSDSDV